MTSHPQQTIRSHAGLRGIAALAVVLLHYRQNLTPAFDIDQYTQFLAGAGAFVDLFFVLSGFILAANYTHWFSDGVGLTQVKGFLQRRVARIYPLHLATIIAFIGLLAVAGKPMPAASDVIENLLMIHAWGMNDVYILNFPSWSISAEWMLYLLFPFFAFACARPTIWTSLVAAATIAYAALFAFGDGFDINERLSLWRAIPAFIFGMSLFVYRDADTGLSATARNVLQVLSLFGIVAILHSGSLSILLIPLFSLLVLITRKDTGSVAAGLGVRPLVWLGDISYSIYMLHVPIRAAMYLVFGKLGLDLATPQNATVFVVVCLAATLLCGALSFRLFETPARRWVGGR
ncbi:acyltransferase family protein [Yoonia sp. R2331]|uniref:acyltransferase family protein n=1 Tax=Yoonia sp. R2331 TaxID=3237238 RepID=UPI0034E4E4EA